MTRGILRREHLATLFDALGTDGRRIIGPTVRDGAIVLDRLTGPEDLPAGWSDTQEPGRYRLTHRGGERLFEHVVGPDSLKRFLYPAHEVLWTAEGGRAPEVRPGPVGPRLAVIGARACDLAALAIHDKVLIGSGATDPQYASRRAELVIVAVQCASAASTCFCASMNSGPRVSRGYDLALTELLDEAGHRFVVEVGSQVGEALAAALPLEPVGEDAEAPERAAAAAEAAITHRLPTEGLRERLLAALSGPHWDRVATRCLGCASCTMVCPTCFCASIEDHTDLGGGLSRHRRWDSCFNADLSYVHGGGPVRADLGSRYRQWLTHKLATWHDQFGTSGCVGCGRCITWCPAGIDIVAEALAAAEEGAS